MELNFKENDIVEIKEDVLETILFMKNPIKAEVKGLTRYIDQKDQIMLHTLMSILFKLRSKTIYTKGKMPKRKEIENKTIRETERIIREFYNCLKENKYDKLKSFIQKAEASNFIDFLVEKKYKNREIIGNLLYKYYLEKDENYIESKFYISTLLNQNSAKEILTLNPYMITQLLDYQQNPLTEEEMIIQEITDYLIEAEQYFALTEEIIQYVIKLFERNNKKSEIRDRKLLFIISNVYQEAKERNDKFYGKMMYILENTKYDPETIIKYTDKKALKEIMNKFIEYNRNIEEGRLEELEKKSSSEYAKKIYRKNP